MSPYYTLSVGAEVFTIETRYRIVRKVGSGAYGTVCSAYDLYGNRYCAIKKIHRVFDKRLFAKRCLREMKLLQHFNGHPRIIELFDMDIPDPQAFNELYLVFDCMDTNLHEVIHSDKPLDAIHGQWFLYQMLSGVQYIHAANVIHRDLKPANVLVNKNCDIKICDFGMARGDQSSETSSFLTEYVTTRWYRAPEIMLSPTNYSQLIDIWSIGCIFGEILGRKVLFKGRDYIDQLHKIIGLLGLPRNMSFWNPGESISAHLEQLCTVDGNAPPTQPVDFAALFPGCSADGIDILQKLLDLNPFTRITATEALRHPFVLPFHDPVEESLRPRPCDFAFENDHRDIRVLISDEVASFRRKTRAMHRHHSDFAQFSHPASDPTETDRSRPMSSATMSLLQQAPQHSLSSLYDENDEGEPSHHPVDTIMSGGLVGEPEEFSVEEERIFEETAGISVDRQRQLKAPQRGPGWDELERALSGTW